MSEILFVLMVAFTSPSGDVSLWAMDTGLTATECAVSLVQTAQIPLQGNMEYTCSPDDARYYQK